METCNSFMSNEDLYRAHDLLTNVVNNIAIRDNIIKDQQFEINSLHNELSSVYSLINEFKSEFTSCENSRYLFTMVNDFIRNIDDLLITS